MVGFILLVGEGKSQFVAPPLISIFQDMALLRAIPAIPAIRVVAGTLKIAE